MCNLPCLGEIYKTALNSPDDFSPTQDSEHQGLVSLGSVRLGV